jgi:hypothetical protein
MKAAEEGCGYAGRWVLRLMLSLISKNSRLQSRTL